MKVPQTDLAISTKLIITESIFYLDDKLKDGIKNTIWCRKSTRYYVGSVVGGVEACNCEAPDTAGGLL